MSGFTLWRGRHGKWEKVRSGLTVDVAQGSARIHNAEATAEATGWTYCASPDGSSPDVKRGSR